jgi:hypothetical protein
MRAFFFPPAAWFAISLSAVCPAVPGGWRLSMEVRCNAESVRGEREERRSSSVVMLSGHLGTLLAVGELKMVGGKSTKVFIGKFDIRATYTFAKALRDGMPKTEAKRRGMVAAIMGAHARLGIPHDHKEFESLKEAAEKRNKTTITSDLFDRQIRLKLARGRVLRQDVSSRDREVR